MIFVLPLPSLSSDLLAQQGCFGRKGVASLNANGDGTGIDTGQCSVLLRLRL